MPLCLLSVAPCDETPRPHVAQWPLCYLNESNIFFWLTNRVEQRTTIRTMTLTPVEVAQMQCTSPDFAEWCVTNVGNPDYQYLFVKALPGRSEYERALAARESELVAFREAAKALKPKTSSTEKRYFGPHEPVELSPGETAHFLGMLRSIDKMETTHDVLEYTDHRRARTESFLRLIHESMVGEFANDGKHRCALFYISSQLFFHHRSHGPQPPPYLGAFAHYLCLILQSTLANQTTEVRDYIANVAINNWMEGLPPSAVSTVRELLKQHSTASR